VQTLLTAVIVALYSDFCTKSPRQHCNRLLSVLITAEMNLGCTVFGESERQLFNALSLLLVPNTAVHYKDSKTSRY